MVMWVKRVISNVWTVLIISVLVFIISCEAEMPGEDLKSMEALQVKEILKHQIKEEEKDRRQKGHRIFDNETHLDHKYIHPYMKTGVVNNVLKSYSRYREMILLKAGSFWMGTNDPQSKTGEYPMKKIAVRSFYMDTNPIINAEYWAFRKVKKFVRTDAEKKGWSWVVDMFLSNETRQYYSMPGARGWAAVKKTYWGAPEGSDSNLDDRWNHPVVHVSWNDARIFCQYHHKRLPSEAEWEYAVKIGVTSHAYPWGDKWERRRANVWQGKWPNQNKKIDGYSITSPVDAYKPQNLVGFYDMIGNVWEWTNSAYVEARARPHLEQPNMVVLKGGSYVDSVSGDTNYIVRNGQRMGQIQDYTAANVGFRCCKDVSVDEDAPRKTTPAPAKLRNKKKIRRYFRKQDEL